MKLPPDYHLNRLHSLCLLNHPFEKSSECLLLTCIYNGKYAYTQCKHIHPLSHHDLNCVPLPNVFLFK